MLLNEIFYCLKPIIPRYLQILLRRLLILYKLPLNTNTWPIDKKAIKLPVKWSGWPDKKKFAFVLTHDIESSKGQKKCDYLLKLEKDMGFRSSFNFVPERYEDWPELRHRLIDHGFEVGIHGLYHDGKLYESKETFQERANRINHYLEEWKAVGFRSPAMHHNLDWIHELKIKYDSSTFDTDPFEPQSDGVATIFPFWVSGKNNRNGYIELPYTLPQDFLLFILMKEKNINIWKEKLDWIAENGGMVLLNTHPDYMNFKSKNLSIQEYPVKYYVDFLEYVKTKYMGLYWHALPKDVGSYFFANYVIQKSSKITYAQKKYKTIL